MESLGFGALGFGCRARVSKPPEKVLAPPEHHRPHRSALLEQIPHQGGALSAAPTSFGRGGMGADCTRMLVVVG